MNRAERAMSRNRDRSRRSTGRGEFDINQMTQARYRKDLGFNMNDADYENYLTETADFNKKSGEAKSQLAGYDAEINKANAEVAKNQKLIDDARNGMVSPDSMEEEWQKYKAGLWEVNVISKDNVVEHTYKMPKDIRQTLHDFGGWEVNGKYYVNASKEMHQAMIDGQDSLRTKFYEKNADALGKAQAGYNTALGQVSNAQGEMDSAREKLAGERAVVQGHRDEILATERHRQEQIDGVRTNFATDKKKRQALFGAPKTKVGRVAAK